MSCASERTQITDQDISIVKHAFKSLLFNDGGLWVKRDSLDVTMGSNGGAEVCDLIGLYILNRLSEKYGKDNVGLYRDDGLILLKNLTGRLAEKAKKDMMQIFEEFNLKTTATANQKITNFLDITLNLSNGSYQPFKKPNDDTIYIHSHSNHPPSIIRQLPISISQRISKLSSDHATFQHAAPTYNNALKHNGFRSDIEFLPDETHTPPASHQKIRTRNITWFNPPFSKNVKTNVGKKFLNLLYNHFPSTNPLSKIFNRNSVKVSYSCIQNMRSVINKHKPQSIDRSID